jgi:hypothetical protein
MSYIPDHLTLKNGIAQSDFIQYSNNDLVITTAGVLKIAGGSGVEASVLLSVAGTDPDDNPIKYTFPDVNIAMPEQDQIISFNSDGTSQFINNGGGGGAVNAVLNTAYPTTANAGAVLVMNGGDAVSSSPTDKIIVDPDFVTVTAVGLTIRGNAVSGTSTVISELVGEFIISNKAPNGTMLLSSEGDITLQTLANIQLTGGVNITGGDNTNNISKNGGNELLVNGENNVYLNSSAGSTFIQSTGGNVNLNCSFGLVNTDAPILIKNLGRLNVDTGSGNLFTVSNDAGPVRLYSDFPVTTQANTSNINFINDTGLFIKDRVSDFESNIKQQGDGDFKILNPNGNIDLLPLGTVNITRVEPQLNFNHTDFPTQQCNIRFQTNTEELILEHFTPDDAARCNIRLGKPDINIETTVGLIPGNINLRTGGSGKTFINDYSLPNINPTADGQLLSCNIDGESSWISATLPPGLLRAINCNLITPTEIVDVVWSNLTPEEQLAWKGGDVTTSDPIQSATGNYWNFTKASVSTAKIGWFIPDDFSALSFQDLQSFWVVIRFNTTTNISTEGSLFLSLQTSPPTGLNTFRTRWNYSNPATPMNQTGYFYKLYALDTITTTTTANLGKGQEVGQTQFKNNPCNVSPELWSIALNKQVLSPTGDTTAGYTTAPLQSISLQTASNIHTFNFDVVSIGYLNKQYNLQFA